MGKRCSMLEGNKDYRRKKRTVRVRQIRSTNTSGWDQGIRWGIRGRSYWEGGVEQQLEGEEEVGQVDIKEKSILETEQRP